MSMPAQQKIKSSEGGRPRFLVECRRENVTDERIGGRGENRVSTAPGLQPGGYSRGADADGFVTIPTQGVLPVNKIGPIDLIPNSFSIAVDRLVAKGLVS